MIICMMLVFKKANLTPAVSYGAHHYYYAKVQCSILPLNHDISTQLLFAHAIRIRLTYVVAISSKDQARSKHLAIRIRQTHV